MVNMTCPVIPDKPNDPKPFLLNGEIDFKAHDVGWLVCGFMALVASISSAWLIWKHLTYYTCPQQQRHIVRLLVMVPVYAIVSFMSYLFYEHALYYQTVRDCYEAVLVTSFFYLILSYTGDTRAEQNAVFRNLELEHRFWVWPLGSWKYRPEGLHFLWLMKICVLQYAIVRPLCTFVAVGTEYFGYYCLHSWMPWFTHVWCALLISISVTVAMYCLIQLYMPVRKLVDPYKPVLKFLSIKTIVFLTFWQDTLLSFLVSFNVIKETDYFTAEQIQAGINALLQCFWMLLFGFIHIKAFSYLPYRPEDRSRTTLRGRALLDSLDFRDWFFEMKESTRYIAARSKGRDYTQAEDLRAKRHQHLLYALGKERTANLETQIDVEKAALPTFWKNKEHEQDWKPSAANRESVFASNNRASPRPTDAYQSLSNPPSRFGFQQASVVPTAASRDAHAERTAELQRLVTELDLQVADQSIVGAEDHDYGYEDDRYERAGLIYRQKDAGSTDDKSASPSKDNFPELTQYHAPTIQLVNVPSLAYDHDATIIAKRTHEPSDIGEQDPSPARKPSKAGSEVHAGRIASWFGWNTTASADEHSQQHFADIHAHAGADNLLEPGTVHGANTAVRSSDMEGTGWWRNYWERISYLGSREPSALGHGQDEEEDPLELAPPAVMREVRAGSWGTRTPPPEQQKTPADSLRRQSGPPELTLNIDGHRRGDMSVDSTKSFSPHHNSPLTRFIQTSRDSFSSLNRDEVRDQYFTSSPSGQPLQSSSSLGPSKEDLQYVAKETAPLCVKKNKRGSETDVARRSVEAPVRPLRTPRTSSLAASARRASTGDTISASKHPDTTTAPPALPSSSAYPPFNVGSSSKHPIVFADALIVPPKTNADEGNAARVAPTKVLAPAVGPKGKLFNLVLPSPLSPARFPYGQEGDLTQPTQAASAPENDLSVKLSGVLADAARSQPQAQSNHGTDGLEGSLRWASQPSKPVKPSAEASSASSIAKIPNGKNKITVGGMSLAQAKAAQAAQEIAELQAQAQARRDHVEQQRGSTSAPKSILKESAAGKGGTLVLPAPSKLASIGMRDDDPYLVGQSATSTVEQSSVRTPPRPERRRVSGPPASLAPSATQTHSAMSTAFEVGSIVPREAVVRASLPANVPLQGYYDSLHRSGGFGPPMRSGRMAGDRAQTHSFATAWRSPRPAMLPPHPSQNFGQPQQPQMRQIQMYDAARHARPMQPQFTQQPPRYQPSPSPQIREQQSQYPRSSYTQPPPRPYPAQAPSTYPQSRSAHPEYPRDLPEAPYPHPQAPRYPQRPQQSESGQLDQRPSQFQYEY